MSEHPNHFRDLLPFGERFRYLTWRLTGASKTFQCRLKSGAAISIRPQPSADYDTAYMIFFQEIYRTELNPAKVKYIVDLGGNVGYASLYLGGKYPNARILTVEPHPVHCELIRSHLQSNGLTDRVTLLQAAGGAKPGRAFLTDQNDSSTVVNIGADKITNGRHSIAVEKIDIFEAVGDGYIDILKIDIEGSEYEILADPRFESLAARTGCIHLEWHRHAAEAGRDWCRDRLEHCGFHVTPGWSCDDYGMLFASGNVKFSGNPAAVTAASR